MTKLPLEVRAPRFSYGHTCSWHKGKHLGDSVTSFISVSEEGQDSLKLPGLSPLMLCCSPSNWLHPAQVRSKSQEEKHFIMMPPKQETILEMYEQRLFF